MFLRRSTAASRRFFHTEGIKAGQGFGVEGYNRAAFPKLEQDNVHMGSYAKQARTVAKERRAWIIAGLLLLGAAAVAKGRTEVPFIARQQFVGLPRDLDVALGKWEFDAMEEEVLLPEHPVSVKVLGLVDKLLGAMMLYGGRWSYLRDCSEWEWKVCVVVDDEPNAAAIPGGKIFVNTGLLDLLTTKQLALILSHEIAHAVARHGMEGLLVSRLQDFFSNLISAGKRRTGLMQDFYSLAGELPHSRRCEMEADYMGLCIATSAGFVFSQAELEEAFDFGLGLYCSTEGHDYSVVDFDERVREISVAVGGIPVPKEDDDEECTNIYAYGDASGDADGEGADDDATGGRVSEEEVEYLVPPLFVIDIDMEAFESFLSLFSTHPATHSRIDTLTDHLPEVLELYGEAAVSELRASQREEDVITCTAEYAVPENSVAVDTLGGYGEYEKLSREETRQLRREASFRNKVIFAVGVVLCATGLWQGWDRCCAPPLKEEDWVDCDSDSDSFSSSEEVIDLVGDQTGST